jgi:hypothetical protein
MSDEAIAATANLDKPSNERVTTTAFVLCYL